MIIHSLAPYTRFVNSAKLLLGLLVLVLTAIMFLYPVIKKNSSVRIAFTSVDKTASAPTKMLNANFHGFDESNQPYNVTAETAIQVDEDNITFDKINGDIALNSGKWLSIQADKGDMKIKEKLLYLHGKVEMFTDEGYELSTETLHVDIGKKLAVTQDVVKGHGLIGTLQSLGAVLDGNQKTATFNKPVFVRIYLPAHESQPVQKRK